ncbi:MAG: N-6 DNA methylase [Chloroflexota bacterium]|nr:N-6 DNA methylase [Chloroflexota bacterium]
MLTDPKLKSQVDALWDKLWTGGLSNPLDAIEQFSYLLFMKRLDEEEDRREKRAKMLGQKFTPRLKKDLRWRYWTQLKADDALKHVKDKVFPALKDLGGKDSSFEQYMMNAEFKISKPALLIEACKLIDQMELSAFEQDIQGDLYEYLLSHLAQSGRNGQFFTPRHIIRMMVQMVKPKPRERIGDMAAGTGGFLFTAYQYILETHTSPKILERDAEGAAHHLIGDLLSPDENRFLQTHALRGFDNDSGMTMLRIGSMNLMLHGITSPRFFYMDTLTKAFKDTRDYDVILMNPPFKGKVDASDIGEGLPSNTTKSELLFVHLILRVLDSGGRCAVIVPDGVLFGSSRAHVELRRKLIEENRLDGVVSMPSGVFKPYAGVSTAVLLFTRGATTERIWFYDMEHDGFSLDDKRTPTPNENDIPDVLQCWENRFDAGFNAQREKRLRELRDSVAPLKTERLRLQKEINRLTFESVIASEAKQSPSGSEIASSQSALLAMTGELDKLHDEIAPLQAEMNQLTRQFWVTKEQVAANKYDLSASRYRQIEQDEEFYEEPQVTLERLLKLESVMANEVEELKGVVK